MTRVPLSVNDLVPDLFKLEHSKMTAVLCRHFGLTHIEIAEDMVSETFLTATHQWGLNGVPENPVAWLYTVARNKTINYLKRAKCFERYDSGVMTKEVSVISEPVIDFTERNIHDSQLEMMFVLCDPVNSPDTQVCLALQILCGLSVDEIANGFLTSKETIKKRLHRGRNNLRNKNFKLTSVSVDEMRTRLEAVLKTLYLLYNEGYFSRSNEQIIRKELCAEAMRLVYLLTETPLTRVSKVMALLALMCYQSSRIEARINEWQELVLFEEQDRSRWNKELIDRGNVYLVQASESGELSGYHLEASIAYWHSTQGVDETEKWKYILQLYNRLLQMEYSTAKALNRTFAFAKVYGHDKALTEALKLDLSENGQYHSLLGYLYSVVDLNKAIEHYTIAAGQMPSVAQKDILEKRIKQLSHERRKAE